MIGRSRKRVRELEAEVARMAVEAARARFLIEESREVVLVLAEDRSVLAASRRARELFPAVALGRAVPGDVVSDGGGWRPLRVPYELDGRREELVYLVESDRGAGSAYEELRVAFTAAVSHELRTPLARLLVLLESALLPGADQRTLIGQAQAEVEQTRELIDDVLFLSELETGNEVVSLGSTLVRPVLQATLDELRDRADLAGVTLRLECAPEVEVPLRQRMLEIVAKNLAENAVRHAGRGATFTLAAEATAGGTVLRAADDGAGVPTGDLPQLFERFYRADRARSSRGTGLGLAIVKHVVTAAGGSVEASGGPGRGLQIACTFPAR